MGLGDGAHLLLCLTGDGGLGGHQHHHKPQVLHLFQRLQAAAQIARLVQGGCVVVRGNRIAAGAVTAPGVERRDDDDWIHAIPFPGPSCESGSVPSNSRIKLTN